MCGRFYEFSPLKKLVEVFDLGEATFEIKPSYNIAPGQEALAVVGGESHQLTRFRWGLIPAWAGDENIGYKMINARSETVHEKPSFRSAFKKRRCLVVADGFYEWQRSTAGKIPYSFSLRHGNPFGLAGLHESWTSPAGEEVMTCTILTCEANELVAPVHDRMPVILPQTKHAMWLDPEVQETEALLSLLKPYKADLMQTWEVSALVNSPQNNSANLIEPVGKMF